MLESSKVPALTRAIDILNLIARIVPVLVNTCWPGSPSGFRSRLSASCSGSGRRQAPSPVPSSFAMSWGVLAPAAGTSITVRVIPTVGMGIRLVVSRGNSRSESASTSRPGQALVATRHKPGLRTQTRFVISRIGFTGFWHRCQASACASRVMGCSQRLLVDISICHLQVSQSVITRSAPLSSICRNSGAPMACEEG